MPARKPTELKKRQGTFRKDRARGGEPVAPPGRPTSPDYMDDIAVEYWNRICDELEKKGLCSPVYAPMLEMLCDAYSQYTRAQAILDKEGMTYVTTTRSGQKTIRKRPEVAIVKDWRRQLLILLRKFGLSPSDRMLCFAEEGLVVIAQT